MLLYIGQLDSSKCEASKNHAGDWWLSVVIKLTLTLSIIIQGGAETSMQS